MSALVKLPGQGVVLREAMVADVPPIVELLDADQLGATATASPPTLQVPRLQQPRPRLPRL